MLLVSSEEWVKNTVAQRTVNSSQLSHLSEALSQIIRVDPFTLFPREVCLRVLGYLDAISLGKAAQVSKLWKNLADDDLLWRRMCGQHIERKCTKCGWGLPLLERRRLRKELNLGAPDRMMVGFEHDDHDHAHTASQQDQQPGLPETIAATSTKGHRLVSLPRSFTAPAQPNTAFTAPSTVTHDSGYGMSDLAGPSSLKRPATEEMPSLKRRRMDSSSRLKQRKSDVSSDSDTNPVESGQDERSSNVKIEERKNKKPWKHVYCERLIVERNWRKGRYTERTLKVRSPVFLAIPTLISQLSGSHERHYVLAIPSKPVYSIISSTDHRIIRSNGSSLGFG